MITTRLIRWFPTLVAGSALVLTAAIAAAANFPERPVRILVGYPPGGGADTVTRLLARKLSEGWGQPMVVDNRPGAGGTIANNTIAQSTPDGYTILMATNDFAVAPSIFKVEYDPIKSFARVTMLAFQPNLLVVNSSLPVDSVKDLIAMAKAKPGQLNFGSAGTGSVPSLGMFLLMKMTGIKMIHVPFKGGGEAMGAILAGEVQTMFSSIPTTIAQVKAGKLKALAITTKARSPLMPTLPTVAEAGDIPGFEFEIWYGLMAPPGTPKDIINKLHADAVAALRSPELNKALAAQGFTGIGSSPEEFTREVISDIAKWSTLIKTMETK